MTEGLGTTPYGSYHQGVPRQASQSGDEGLGSKKTMLVLVVVVGCFAVLWPKLFYPMLVNNANSQMKPGPVDKTTGCCDVISELDLDTIKIMSELCSTIIDTTAKTPPSPQEIVTQCRKAVLETCGIDISAALQDRVDSLGQSVKQILEEVRSLNGSLCLKYNFGLSPWRLGVPHRVNINLDPINSIKQERSSHLRSEMVHPAFKERGRAIPQPDASGLPKKSSSAPRIVEGRPGPIPGMRPAMGGPGHVVAPSKQSNYGFMGVLMPIYTVGFVVFFTYTVMKLVFKKKPEVHVGAPLYPPCENDEEFHKDVFVENKSYFHRPNRDSSKIVVNAVSALLEEVNQELEARKVRMPEPLIEQDEINANGSLPKEEEQGTVTVMGMETTTSCESGKKWSRPHSPVLPHPHPVALKEPSPPPQQIFLEGSLPPLSQILVADSATEAQKNSEDDSPVVLAGKMTLSVISLDSETGTEDSSNSGKRAETSDEERRTSSSNVSEEFEKINAADLEDQINNIIAEAENIALTEENRYSLSEELDKFTEEIHKAPQISEKDKESDVLEEIKNQLNLDDDLLLSLKEKEPEGKVSLPLTDIIKEFLSNEENALLEESKGLEIGDLTKEGIAILPRDKRSLSEEIDGQEIKLNEDLKECHEINKVGNEETGTSVTGKEDLELSAKEQEGLVTENQDSLNLINEELDKQLIDENVNIADNDEVDLPQKGETEAANIETQELQLSVEQKLVSEKTEQNLIIENEIIPEEELQRSVEEKIDSEKTEQNLIIENEVIPEGNAVLLQAVSNTELSTKDYQDLISVDHEKHGNDSEIKNQERTPEETNGNNKADLLLQGLMVKEDKEPHDQNEAIAEVASAEISLDPKALDVTSIEALVEKDNAKVDKQEQPEKTKEDISLTEEKQLVQDEINLHTDQPVAEGSQERTEETKKEEISEQNVVTEHLNREENNSRLLDAEEGLIDDADYDDDSENEELIDDEVRDINRHIYEDGRQLIERIINGEDVDSARNGPATSGTAAENEVSEDEDIDNDDDDDDEEIEEIIEYVDNTDEEGEEVIEINGNEHRHLNENGEN